MRYPVLATAAALLTMFFAALAQNAPAPKPADPPAAEVTKPAKLTEPEKKPVPESAQKAIYKAMHAHDKAQTTISTINSQFLQVQAQAKQQMDQAQAQEKESAAALAKAEDEAYKLAGLDRAEFAIDDDSMQFTAKAKPQAKSAPAPPPAPHQ